MSDDHEHDLGLTHDLEVLDHHDAPADPHRRRALQVLGATGALGLGLTLTRGSPAAATVTGVP